MTSLPSSTSRPPTGPSTPRRTFNTGDNRSVDLVSPVPTRPTLSPSFRMVCETYVRPFELCLRSRKLTLRLLIGSESSSRCWPLRPLTSCCWTSLQTTWTWSPSIPSPRRSTNSPVEWSSYRTISVSNRDGHDLFDLELTRRIAPLQV